jgi:hypothetical protein
MTTEEVNRMRDDSRLIPYLVLYQVSGPNLDAYNELR